MSPINKSDINVHPDEVSIKELILKIQQWWSYLLSQWRSILLACIITGILGFVYAIIKKPLYQAELSFVVQDDKASMSGALSLASQFGIDLGGGSAGGEFTGDNLLELIKSRSMITRALLTPISVKNKRQTLAEYYIEFNNLRNVWKNEPELKNIHFLPGPDSAKLTLTQDSILSELRAALIKNNLTVDKADKKLSIIAIDVKSKDELFSKYFTEVLAKVVSDFYIQTKTGKAAKNVAILQKQTDSVRRILNNAITNVAVSTDINPNPNPNLSALRVPSQHRQVDVQANSAILNQLATNLEIAKMSLLQETPLIQIIDKPILPLEKDSPGKVKYSIIGILVGGILMSLIVLLKFIYKGIMNND